MYERYGSNIVVNPISVNNSININNIEYTISYDYTGTNIYNDLINSQPKSSQTRFQI